MADFFGVTIPNINVTGFFSSSWIYVLIIALIGIVFVTAIGLLLFFSTYRRRIILFENVSGIGYQPILRTRARIVKLGTGGGEVLKTLAGGHFLSAYGRKMGKNTYWYAKGPDGYWYNFLLGDLDTKMAILDVEPVDRDVRMFHTAIDRLSHLTYGKSSFLERYGIHLMLFAFLIIMLVGAWIIVGKINEGLQTNAQSSELASKVLDRIDKLLQRNNNLQNQFDETESGIEGSGLVPAEEGGG